MGSRRHPAEAGSCCSAVGLGLGGGVCDDCFAVADGDLLSGERLQLSGEIVGAAVLVDSGFVISGPEVTECGVGVGEQVVDDGQYRVAGGDDRLLLTAAAGQAPIAGAQEGVGARVGERDAAEVPASHGLPLP